MKKIIFIFYGIVFFFAILANVGATTITLTSQGDMWNYFVIDTPMPNFYSASYASFDWENATWMSGQAAFGNIYQGSYLLSYNTVWPENTYLALNKVVNVNGSHSLII